MLVQGHLVDPIQYASYHAFKHARVVLSKQPALHEAYAATWHLISQGAVQAPGPVKELFAAVRRLGWSWSDPWNFSRPSKSRLPLLGGEDAWWLHEIRDGLRISQWKIAASRRHDMQGLASDHGIDRLATMAVMTKRKHRSEAESKIAKLIFWRLTSVQILRASRGNDLSLFLALPSMAGLQTK